MNHRRKVPKGTFSVVCMMQGFKVCVFHFAEAVIENLLSAAASVSAEDMGAFADSLTVADAVFIFCQVHGKTPFVFG